MTIKTGAAALAALIALGACGGGTTSTPGYRAALAEVRRERSTLGEERWPRYCADVAKLPVPSTISDRSIGAANPGTARWTVTEMVAALREECGR